MAFRFLFIYFAIFACGSLLDVGTGPRKLLAALSEPPVRWFARSVFHLDGPASVGGPRWAASQQIVAFAIAAVLTGVWTLVGRRTEYDRLRGWSVIVLRYYVAVIMLVYGGLKVVDSQFPPLMLEQVASPLGSLAPMGLLWAFMGYSATYASFTGLGESIGAFLLFFRRTTTAGALILIAVLSNVALLNYTFDVPVKQLSFNLLLASAALAALDVKRVIDVFLLNRPTSPRDLSFDVHRRWISTVRRFLKPIIVVGATAGPLAFSMVVHTRLVRTPPLYGVYDVEEFARNGVRVPASSNETTRWRQVVFSRSDALAIRFMNDSTRALTVRVDTAAHRLTVRRRNRDGAATTYAYEPTTNGGLRLRGVSDGDTLDVTVRKLDHEQVYRLLRTR